MIKCPHCGSTAQVRKTYNPTVSDNEEILTEGYICGCGCHFSVEYKRNDEGLWEHYWTCVEYVKAKPKIKQHISDEDFTNAINYAVEKALDPNQPGGAWFNGNKEELSDWCGDLFTDMMTYVLEYYGIAVEYD